MTQLGALSGLSTEQYIKHKINWHDADARSWLNIMGISPDQIRFIEAQKAEARAKTDLKFFLQGDETPVRGMSVKSTRGESTGGHLTRFWPTKLNLLFGLEPELVTMLQEFTGEHYWEGTREGLKRVMIRQQPQILQDRFLEFLTRNKKKIISWMFKSDEAIQYFMIVTRVATDPRFYLYRMEDVIEYYSEGDPVITPRGFKLGRITFQRKGGDKGLFTACQLQSKITSKRLPIDTARIATPSRHMYG
jgi:hypothetical protein